MKKLLILVSTVLFLAAGVAIAQPGMMGMMSDELKLTDQQMEQMQKIHLDLQRQMIQKKAELATAKLDLKEIMMKNDVDEKAALSAQDKISAIKASIAKMKLQQKLAMKKLLTPEQRDKMMKMHRGKGPMGKRGCCMGMGGPKGPMMGGPGCGMMGPGGMMKMQDDQKQTEIKE